MNRFQRWRMARKYERLARDSEEVRNRVAGELLNCGLLLDRERLRSSDVTDLELHAERKRVRANYDRLTADYYKGLNERLRRKG